MRHLHGVHDARQAAFLVATACGTARRAFLRNGCADRAAGSPFRATRLAHPLLLPYVMKTLVACYSRTGNTRAVGLAIASAIGADFDLVVSREPRHGALGYLRCNYDAMFARQSDIARPTREVVDYDLVIVGSPTWGSSLSSPVRTYLTRYASWLHPVAFFVTCSGHGGQRAIDQMCAIAGRDPVATLVVREANFQSGQARAVVDEFARRAVRDATEHIELRDVGAAVHGAGRSIPASFNPRAVS
jgi:hypothetical protein